MTTPAPEGVPRPKEEKIVMSDAQLRYIEDKVWIAEDWEALRRYKIAMLQLGPGNNGDPERIVKNIHAVAVALVNADVKERADERHRAKCDLEGMKETPP